MFKLSDTEIARLKACDHVVVKEPEFDQGAIRALLRDKHCPVEAIPMLLALVDKETGFEIPYTTATKRNPECSMRRRYAKPKDKQVSVQALPKVVRERLLPQQVYEVDVEVAAFAMFQAVFFEAKQPCPYISEYFNDKTRIRTWLSQETGLHVKKVKAHLSAMHACQGYVWPNHSSLLAMEWIEALRTEIKEAYALLRRYSPVFSTYVAEAKTYKQENIEGAAMAMYRELQERRIMCAVQEYLDLVRFPVCGLIHDALLFRVPDDEEVKMDVIKAELEQFATRRVGFPVKFGLECAHKAGPLDPPRERIIFPDYTPFDDHRLREIFFDEGIRCLVINAGMNIGKTFEVGRFLASLPGGTALVISTKILHAISSQAELVKHPGLRERIKCYLDPELDLEAFRDPSAGQINIVQNESLHKLLGMHVKRCKPFLARFDYIVLDEVRSLLKQTISEKTHKHHLKMNQSILEWFCRRSKCIALDADAFLDRAVVKFCRKEFGGLWEDHQLEVHKYTHQALPRTCLITFKAGRFAEALKHAVETARLYRERHGESRPVVANCRCKRRVYELLAMLFPRPDGGLPKFGDNNTFVFTGDNNEGLEVFHDINKFIRENSVDLIIYSPKLTCAASIDEPVTAAFADASDKGCVIRDWAQGAGRARNVDNNLLHVLMPQGHRTVTWAGSENYEEFLVDKLRRREQALRKRLQKYSTDVVFTHMEGRLLRCEALEEKIPDWVVNNIATNVAEEDRSNRDPASEIFRLIQYKQWSREFVDIDPDTAFGFFLPTTEALPASKRRKLDKAARAQVKDEDNERWFEAFERVKALPYDQLAKLQSDKQAPLWDKAAALLFWNFAHCSESLTTEHCKWYWKQRRTLFHVQALTMSRQELEKVDYSKLLFIFKKKTLATAKSILEAVDAVKTLLAELRISHDAFIGLTDGSIHVTLEQLQAASAQIDACWQKIASVLWRPRAEVEKTTAKPAVVFRHILQFFGRVLQAHNAQYKQKVTDWHITCDPMFTYFYSRLPSVFILT